MAKKSKRPSWFKLWLHHKSLFDALPDDVAGRAVKAALHYFATGEILQLGQLEMVAFSAIKADVDDAHADYQRDVENGKRGGRPRLSEEKPPVKGGNPPPPMVTEGEEEGEREGEEKKKDVKADKPPKPLRHKYGEYKNVLLSDEEFAKLQSEIPCWQEMIERLSSYMESHGRTYKSHLATMRNWYRKEQSIDKGKDPMPDYGGAGNWSL